MCALPLPVDEFFQLFLENDQTVSMLAEQNKNNSAVPSYIGFENPNSLLFANG